MTSLYDAQPEANDILNNASDEERMNALVNALSAYIEHYHGGAVKMVNYDGKTLQVKMSGACAGCQLAPVTLHGWVEGTVKQFFPDLETVEAV